MKALKIIVVLVIVAIVAGLVACPIVNDMTAKDIENDLISIAPPSNSSVVKSISASGKIRKSATVMQYYGAVLIQSSMKEEFIKQYYKEKDPDIFVVSQQNGKTELADIDKELRFGEYDENATKNAYYIIYKWGSGQEPFNILDYRVMFG